MVCGKGVGRGKRSLKILSIFKIVSAVVRLAVGEYYLENRGRGRGGAEMIDDFVYF